MGGIPYDLREDDALPDWVAYQYREARNRAKKRGIAFKMSPTDFRDVYWDSDGVCAVTGVPFSFEKYPNAFRRPYVPSVDRIDSKVGYTRKNSRLVLACVNIAMNEWGEDVFRTILDGFKIKELAREIATPQKNVAQKIMAFEDGAFYSESALVFSLGLDQGATRAMRLSGKLVPVLFYMGARKAYGYTAEYFIARMEMENIDCPAAPRYLPTPLEKPYRREQ